MEVITELHSIKQENYDFFLALLIAKSVFIAYCFDLLWARRYNVAISVSREALKIDSTSTFALNVLMFAFHLTGRYNETLEPWKKSYYIGYPGFVHAFDQGYVKAGCIGALSLAADTFVAQSKTKYVNPGDIAYRYSIQEGENYVDIYSSPKYNGFSVRCIKDN